MLSVIRRSNIKVFFNSLIILKYDRIFLKFVYFWKRCSILLFFVQQLNNGEIDNCFSTVYKQRELFLFLFNLEKYKQVITHRIY